MLYCSVCTVLYCTVLQVPHQAGDGDKVIEAAVFLDHVGYSRLAQVSQLALVSGHLNIDNWSGVQVYSDEDIESVLLAYINQAAALYHIPSLGQQVDIMITYLGNTLLPLLLVV